MLKWEMAAANRLITMNTRIIAQVSGFADSNGRVQQNVSFVRFGNLRIISSEVGAWDCWSETPLPGATPFYRTGGASSGVFHNVSRSRDDGASECPQRPEVWRCRQSHCRDSLHRMRTGFQCRIQIWPRAVYPRASSSLERSAPPAANRSASRAIGSPGSRGFCERRVHIEHDRDRPQSASSGSRSCLPRCRRRSCRGNSSKDPNPAQQQFRSQIWRLLRGDGLKTKERLSEPLHDLDRPTVHHHRGLSGFWFPSAESNR